LFGIKLLDKPPIICTNSIRRIEKNVFDLVSKVTEVKLEVKYPNFDQNDPNIDIILKISQYARMGHSITHNSHKNSFRLNLDAIQSI
jgi:hypothetical protein